MVYRNYIALHWGKPFPGLILSNWPSDIFVVADTLSIKLNVYTSIYIYHSFTIYLFSYIFTLSCLFVDLYSLASLFISSICICLPLYLSICCMYLPISFTLSLSIFLFIYSFPCIYLLINLHICLPGSISLLICLFIFIYLYIYLYIRLSPCSSLHLPVAISVFLSSLPNMQNFP